MAFNVKIIDINENFDNIILVDNLTIEILKIKYNWFLNASVKNCIIGENEIGLVWYSGEWICGEWENGTWYSGIWHDGIWKNGNWYSYKMDSAMIISNRFVVLDENRIYSQFKSGIWCQGNFYNGIFGDETRDIKNKSYQDLINRNFISSYWEDGKFYTGLFISSVWENGIFYNGNMNNSYWLNGKFYSGEYNFPNPQGPPTWYNGLWYGGDFIEGVWNNGSFDQINIKIKSRFGLANLETSSTDWINGNFYNGEFHSGLNIDSSGNTIPSLDCNITHWYNGNFKGGNWYGGHFHNGNFDNGNWHGGIFGTDTGSLYYSNTIWNNGMWYNGLWINGTFKNGHFFNGMWLDGQFINGYISTNTTENTLLTESLYSEINLPSVTAYTVSDITNNSAFLNGRVYNNGGANILERGICWSSNNTSPITGNTIDNYYTTDGGTMGSFSIKMSGLLLGTQYYVRSYAKNITGITYSNTLSFVTTSTNMDPPQVVTLEAGNITSSTARLNGNITNSVVQVNNCGFYYSSGDTTNPTPFDFVVTATVPDGYNGTGDFYADINSLSQLNTYYFKAFAESINGIGTGSTVSFITSFNLTPTASTVMILEINNITDITAEVTGQIMDNGNSTVTTVGACWSSTNNNPTILDDNATQVYDKDKFYITMSGLLPNTSYYVKVFAENSWGVSYSNVTTFTTDITKTKPVVLLIRAEATR